MGCIVEKLMFKSDLEKLSVNHETSLFDFVVKDIDGKTLNLADFKGNKKAFIVTNVACACGLTG